MKITIAEIKKVQKDKPKEQFIAYYFLRKVSRYITYFLLKINPDISPNSVTAFSLFWTLTGLLLLSFPINTFWVIGSLMYIFFFILDCVDGEVARFSKKASLIGSFWDALVHLFVNPAALIFPSWGLYQISHLSFIVYLGIFAAISDVAGEVLRMEWLSLSQKEIIEEPKEKPYFTKWQKASFLKKFIYGFLSFEGMSILLFFFLLADIYLKTYYFRFFLLSSVSFFLIVRTFLRIKNFLKSPKNENSSSK